MRVTEKELAEIRRELERQERELGVIEASLLRHREVELHLASDAQEQLETITASLKRRPAMSVLPFVVRA